MFRKNLIYSRYNTKSCYQFLQKMSTIPNNTHVKINNNFSIAGALDLSSIGILDTYKSCLYLTPDSSSDSGCEGGFQTVVNKMGSSNAIKIAIDVTAVPFTNNDMIQGLSLYKEIENAIDKLGKPILLLCKSNRRAGAVYSLYNSIKENKDKDKLFAEVNELGLSFPSAPPLLNWVLKTHQIKTSLPILRRQFVENQSSTYSYLIICNDTKDAIIIDPVIETAERDAQIIKDMGINLKYCLNTHVHADHITGSGKLKAIFPCLSVISNTSGAVSDIKVSDGVLVEFGKRFVTCLSTPGHTEGCMSFVLDDLSCVYTGVSSSLSLLSLSSLLLLS